MPAAVSSLIDALLLSPPATVEDAGRTLLHALARGEVSADAFLHDPSVLTSSAHAPSRYVAQVVWRALKGDYETVDEVVAGLYGVLDRNPPMIVARPATGPGEALVAIPEARVLRVPRPEALPDGGWAMTFEAQATSGEFRDREIRVRVLSSVNPTSARIVPHFWVHAGVSLYNLKPVDSCAFEAVPETFFVLEPLRQVNATSVARALHCPKPQIDQIRRGRGDVTVHTLKGMVVHSMFDRLIHREDEVDAAYAQALPAYLTTLAAIAGDDFDEDAFRADAIRHGRALEAFIDRNPHVRRDPQVELRRYSATIGIQGRIDAVVRTGDRLDVVELKTGKRVREEDHAQLFIYRLLLSDYIRRERADGGGDIELTSRLLSSHDGSTTPMRVTADFHSVMEARNRLLAHTYAMSRSRTHLRPPYAGYDAAVCDTCPSWTAARCREDSTLFGDRPAGEQGEAAGAGDADAAAIGYFRKYSRLVQHESWLAGQELADLLDDSRLGLRLRNFRTIAGARCAGRDPRGFKFEFAENASDLGPGDPVLVHSGRISATISFHGFVRAIDPRSAVIAIPIHNLPDGAFGDGGWHIDRFPSDYTAQSSQTGLYDFLRSPADGRKRAILGDLAAGSGHPATPGGGGGSGPGHARGGLNASQLQAVDSSLEAPVFHLIWGPPGTGKTRVLAEIVAGARERDPKRAVLLGAFTNTALDRMLLSLLDRDPGAEFMRVGRLADSPELAARLGVRASNCFSEDLALSTDRAVALRRRMDQIGVVAATAHRAATHPYVRGRTFGLAIIDEAAQLTEPLTLGLVMRAKRFVLIGDDRQLPPVVRSQPLGVSMFERMKQSAQREAPGRLTLLDTQYRMHPEIMAASNRLFYGGRLSSGVDAADRVPPFGDPIAFVPVVRTPVAEPFEGRTNAAEAEAVARVVGTLVESVAPDRIGVISPFRAQVVLLRRLLAGTGVVADTVERFQGGERDAIVLSLVRSRGTGFVFDDRRFNVAITRARRKLILVAHPELFRNTRYESLSGFGPL